jgi:hypothetical protein
MTSAILQAKTRSIVLLLIVAGTVLSICMGLRQSLGLFLEPIRANLGVSASAFGFAMALQNLVWGLTALRDRPRCRLSASYGRNRDAGSS